MVNRRGDLGCAIGILELDRESARTSLSELVCLVEIGVVDPANVSAALPLLVLAVVDADKIEGPGLAPVLLREDVRSDRDLVADLPAVLVRELAADDHGGARVCECFPLAVGHDVLGIDRM